MASTTAMYTGLSGLIAHARSLDVIGNNISNVNTTAFKSSRVNFITAHSKLVKGGTAPAEVTGGTNPHQIGFGVRVGGVQKDFRGGSVSATGDPRDLAVDGEGFFIVERDEDQLYTRDGAFRQDAEGYLTNATGDRLLGYGVDSAYNIAAGGLSPINIPLGRVTLAQATSLVTFAGNLDADGDLPSRGASIRLFGDDDTGLSLISTADPAPTDPNVIESTSLLTDVEDPELPDSDTPFFSVGQFVEVTGAERGSAVLPTTRFEIAEDSTIADLLSFLSRALGIRTGESNPDAATSGVDIDTQTGVLTITGNVGTVNDLELDASDVRLLDSDGSLSRLPFVVDKAHAADGESVRTSMIAYDSLGSPVVVDVAMTLVDRGASGTTWRYDVESRDDTSGLLVASGELDFDPFGVLDTTDPVSIEIDRDDTGAASPLAISLEFSDGVEALTALADESSQLAATSQDGAPIGTLTSFSIGTDGVIAGAFSNGLVRSLGQVVVATFSNPEGVLDLGSNLYQPAANSGEPVVKIPGSLGAGQVISGALELSNVDLGEEFIKLILTSTGYSASTRIIRTSDELLQQLLVLGR